MRLLKLLLCCSASILGQYVEDDGIFDREVYLTETQTLVTTEHLTPIFWSVTPTTVTVHPTPVPTTVDPLASCRCPIGYRCALDTQREIVCKPACLDCPKETPHCKCRDDQTCVVNAGSCFKCPFTSCLDTPLRCLECPTCFPECSCEKKADCVYHEQTCDSCAHYTCGGNSSQACPPVPEECTPECRSEEVCAVRTNKLSGCKERRCVAKACQHDEVNLLVDPCNFCHENEECKIIGGIRKCIPKALKPCLNCPELNTDLPCGEHEHLVVTLDSCQQCGSAACVPDPCYNCFTFPIPIKCAPGESSVLIPPSCYDCGKYACVKKEVQEPSCSDCKEGICVIKDIADGVPVSECLPHKCVECPIVATCSNVQCPEGHECRLSEATCKVCPKPICVPKLPAGCAPSSCASTRCPVGTQCVMREGECPQAECANSDDCIICPQVMPTCDCENDFECQYVKQTCLACSHYKCVKPIECPEAPKCCDGLCKSGFSCAEISGDSKSCPSIACLPEACKECSFLLPRCKGCHRDEICHVTIGGCHECAHSECRKDPSCKECPEVALQCECKENEQAIIKLGDCDDCPSCECDAKPCIECPARDVQKEDCSQCTSNERCEISPRGCYECEKGRCVRKCVECDPLLTECHCKEGERCRILPGDCQTCPRAICDPACPALSCQCKPFEVLEQYLDQNGCPGCRCTEKGCPAPNKRFPMLIGSKKLTQVCIAPEEVRQCPLTMPVCTCPEPSDCIYEGRTWDSCAEYKCRKQCVECPAQAPVCECGDPSKCVLQPRSCDRCSRYYCREECTECPAAEDKPVCACKDPNDCLLRPRTCLFCAHYECVPPSKFTGARI